MNNSSPSPNLTIRPVAKRNGLVSITSGVAFFLLAFSLKAIIPQASTMILLPIYGLALVLIAIGVAKLIEPETSLQITPDSLTYQHRKGRWCISWESILRIDVPHYRRGLDHKDMPYLGLRLHDEDELLSQISPRLAVYLMLEQRPILVAALRSEQPEETDFAEYFDPPSVWTSRNGMRYEGIKAAFAHRMHHLRTLLGYDLYIAETAFDRPLSEFIDYLKALQQTRHQFQSKD